MSVIASATPAPLPQETATVLLIACDAAGASVLAALESSRPGGRPPFEVQRVSSLAAGVVALRHEAPACVLLDLAVPDAVDGQGLERLLHTRAHVPIVVLAALEDEALALEALEAGAQDYLVTEHLSSAGIVQMVRFAIERSSAEQALRDVELEAGRAREVFASKLADMRKLEALGVLAGGVAHDFNNLLTVILANTSLVRSALTADSPQQGQLEQIELASQRCAQLAQQMLAYSGRGNLAVAVVDFATVIGSLDPLIRATIPETVELTLSLAQDTPSIEADAGQLRQVILNLVTNASEAIGDDTGTITIRTARSTVMSAEDDLGNPEAATYALLEVTDTGSGMGADILERIFEPFYTTKFTGRGLGLAAAEGIVRSHHGSIEVSTQPGAGTSFRVMIPAATRPGSAAPDAAAPDAGRLEGTVLVVDDDAQIRTLATYLLESFGLGVVTADDGLQAVRAVVEDANRFAFVLLDLVMPRMGGEEVVDEFDRLGLTVPVILSSGYQTDDLSSRFRGRRIAGFLQKPYTIAQLRAVAVEALRATP